MPTPTDKPGGTSAGDPGLAIVTGASSGIGEVYASRLAERGHDLLLIARRRDRLAALQEKLHDQHRASVEIVPTDLLRTGTNHPSGQPDRQTARTFHAGE